jgi:hypothetical protein
MKKALGLLLAICLGAALERVLNGVPVTAAAGGGHGGAAISNGDVNGDGTIDISDAVYLLSSLFLGGPAPVAIECSVAGGVKLPATGQRKCYNAVGEVLDCSSLVFKPCLGGQDGFYHTGCPSAGRFFDNGDGTVTDHCTGLMWQKDTADTNGDGVVTGMDALAWCDALRFCDNLKFAGHEDWRLPNIRELESIIDYGDSSVSLDPVFGEATFSLALQWSSTTHGLLTDRAWGIAFFDGAGADVVSKDILLLVRAVRTAP